MLVGKAARLVRRVGPHPAQLAAETSHRLASRGRRARLRHAYGDRIAGSIAPAALAPPRPVLDSARSLPHALAAGAERIRAEAEQALSHVADCLGSGPVALGARIDWQLDFKSGYRWPCDFYQDVEVTRLDDASDAKVPWELSRGHHLLTLARAAVLFGDERFAAELERQLSAWIDANPPGRGINWVNPMEVAIRAVNWLWAIGTVERLRPLEPALRRRVTHSLQVHGRHIAANLEGSPALRSNHYLADVLGLLALGVCLPGDRAAARWQRFARRELERQILRQVHRDGVGFEASLPYHGLALELLLVAWRLAAVAAAPFSSGFRARLAGMLEVSRSVRHRDGRVPVIGDQDSGRVLPAGVARPPTHDHLLALGAALLGTSRPLDGPPHEEVAWTLGLNAWRELAERPVDRRPVTTAFPAGGLYVLRAEQAKLVAHCGDVGQNGMGGHAHNDVGSFELSYGRALVVDSGTYAYTSDPVARDAFRSARAHNVLVVDGLDMHPVPAGRPFELPRHAHPRVERWDDRGDPIVLVGEHDGYRRELRSVVCRRTITMSRATGAVEVADDVRGTPGPRTLESFVHLAPGTRVERESAAELIATLGPLRVRIGFEGADVVELADGWVSSAYGVREPAPVIRAVAATELPARLRYRILPEGGGR